MIYVVLLAVLNVLFLLPLFGSASRSDRFLEQHLAKLPKNPETNYLS